MVVTDDEAFGPVLSVIGFDTDAEAIQIAIGTPYGLVGGVFTKDIDHATRAAREIRAGQLIIVAMFLDNSLPPRLTAKQYVAVVTQALQFHPMSFCS